VFFLDVHFLWFCLGKAPCNNWRRLSGVCLLCALLHCFHWRARAFCLVLAQHGAFPFLGFLYNSIYKCLGPCSNYQSSLRLSGSPGSYFSILILCTISALHSILIHDRDQDPAQPLQWGGRAKIFATFWSIFHIFDTIHQSFTRSFTRKSEGIFIVSSH